MSSVELAPRAKQNLERGFNMSTLRPGKKNVFSFHGAILMAKDLPWRETMNMALAKLYEAGVPRKEMDQYLWRYRLAVEEDEKTTMASSAFTLDHFAAGFIILSFGNIMALAVFLLTEVYILQRASLQISQVCSRLIRFSGNVKHIKE